MNSRGSCFQDWESVKEQYLMRPAMAYNISNSYFQEFQMVFSDMLHQRGSQLMQYVNFVPVTGETQTIRQYDTGEATIGNFSSAGSTEYSPLIYDRRRLEPKPIHQSFFMTRDDMVKQGMPPVNELAARLSENCGAALDTLIINGIGGTVRTTANGDISLPMTQYISCMSSQFGNVGTTAAQQGLTAAKLSYAIACLRADYVNSPIVCVGSARAIGQVMTDERAASSLYNQVQTQSNGIMTPFAGVNYFVTSERVVKNAPAHKPTDGAVVMADSSTATTCSGSPTCELVYVFAADQVDLGCSKEFELMSDQDSSRNFGLVFQCMGMYDSMRKQEKAVIAIEVNTTGTAFS